ncbi:MAG: MFS transporter [Firmicutes bacterium]|nr:MFS transporter [Bacillota bacterium]
MYMPSLPGMAEYFGAPAAVVNMTMVAFFVSMAVGMLVMGPLSDRSGRKKVLLVSLRHYSDFSSSLKSVSRMIWRE